MKGLCSVVAFARLHTTGPVCGTLTGWICPDTEVNSGEVYNS